MGRILVCPGELANQAARGTLTVSSSDPLFPPEALADGRADEEWRASSASAAESWTVDKALWTGGDLAAWVGNLPQGVRKRTSLDDPALGQTIQAFSVQGPEVARDGTNNAIRLGNGSRLQATVVVRSGERLVVAIEAKTANAAWGAQVFIYDRRTGRHLAETLTSGVMRTWQAAAPGSLRQTVSTSYVELSYTIDAERFVEAGGSLTVLDIWVQSGGGAGQYVYVRQFRCWPVTSIVAVIGPTIDPLVVVRIQAGDTTGSMSNIATMTKRRLAFHALASIASRFIRLSFSGAGTRALRAGEFYLGYYVSLQHGPDPGVTVESAESQQESSGTVHSTTDQEERRVSMSFAGVHNLVPGGQDVSPLAEIREWMIRCRGALHNFLLVWDEDDGRVVLARLPVGDGWRETHREAAVWDLGVEAIEDPLPSATT